MSGEWEGEGAEKRYARGVSWGPVVVVQSDFVTRAVVPGGRAVEISTYVRAKAGYGIGQEGALATGMPLRVDGRQVGVATQHVAATTCASSSRGVSVSG